MPTTIVIDTSSSKRRARSLLFHVVIIFALEKVGRPVAEIEENKREREGDARDEVDPRTTLCFAGEPSAGQKAPAAFLGTRKR